MLRGTRNPTRRTANLSCGTANLFRGTTNPSRGTPILSRGKSLMRHDKSLPRPTNHSLAMSDPIRFRFGPQSSRFDSIRFVRDFTAADSMRFDSCSILQHPIRSDSIRHRKHGCPIRCDSIRSCLSPDSICVCVVTSRRRFDSIRSKVVDSIRFVCVFYDLLVWPKRGQVGVRQPVPR